MAMDTSCRPHETMNFEDGGSYQLKDDPIWSFKTICKNLITVKQDKEPFH